MAQNSVADNSRLLKEDNTVDEKVVRVDKEPRIYFLFFLPNLSDQLCRNHEGELGSAEPALLTRSKVQIEMYP